VSSPAQIKSKKIGEETRLVVETLLEVVPGTEIVAVVTMSDQAVPGIQMEPMVASASIDAFASIRNTVQEKLGAEDPLISFSCMVGGTEWGVLVDPIEISDGVIVGALVVARHGRTWSKRERSLTKAFASLLSQVATQATRENVLLHQRRLDELVTQVAERLMSASSTNRREVLDWTIRLLSEFLGADVAFLRRNDLARGLSILEAEWPVRDGIPDPDPLGEVAFDADPVFMMTRDLREPYLVGAKATTEEYLERVEEGRGVAMVDGAAVPLLLGDTTWGILGFLHFELHAWVPAEINALQAVASMLVQLQGRIDAEERTAYNAYHDDLTGLPNRRALIRELKERIDARRETAVLIIDLDRFKVMNDFLGHASGDRLLVTIADRIRTSIRVNDFAARLGGDEFVFLVDDAVSEMEVLASAYRILKLIAAPVDIAGQLVSHTASIGIAIAGHGSYNGLELLGFADVAMYAAKSRGRNQAVIFDEEMRELANERSRTELTLRQAIEGDGLRLHFQPEVDLATGRLLAVEALVRWQHPTKGILAASDFITVAEETGLVVNIGRWVFAEACRQLAIWRREYPDLALIVRVNMSPAEFVMEDLVEFVESCLRVSGVPGERLCIEITEWVVLDEPEKTARILRGFQALGVEVALDDFGTGFASMSGLKNLPVNILKLDMSFVQGITSDPYDRAIVESIIRLGDALDLKVVAEGIESGTIIDKLLELGCHRGQGYLISRPVAPDALIPILQAGCVPMSQLRPADLDAFDLAHRL
jgi:diguanylate cyclase (GGDEF)-like protein